MSLLTADDLRLCTGTAGATGPAIYVIDSPAHPFEVTGLVPDLASTLVTVPVDDWNDTLTPWPAAGLYREEPPFGGHAADTLDALVSEVIPAFEATAGISPSARALCGYSLGGLFALYALTHSDAFAACACLSGSVWYEGWVEHLRERAPDLAGRFAYLSIGTKERKAARPLLKTVQDRMETCAALLQDCGCQVTYRTGPGNHLQHVPERFAAGLAALDAFLLASTSAPSL